MVKIYGTTLHSVAKNVSIKKRRKGYPFNKSKSYIGVLPERRKNIVYVGIFIGDFDDFNN